MERAAPSRVSPDADGNSPSLSILCRRKWFSKFSFYFSYFFLFLCLLFFLFKCLFIISNFGLTKNPSAERRLGSWHLGPRTWVVELGSCNLGCRAWVLELIGLTRLAGLGFWDLGLGTRVLDQGGRGAGRGGLNRGTLRAQGPERWKVLGRGAVSERAREAKARMMPRECEDNSAQVGRAGPGRRG